MTLTRRGLLVAVSGLVALVGTVVTIVYFFQPWRSCDYEDTAVGCAMLPADTTVMAVTAFVTLAALSVSRTCRPTSESRVLTGARLGMDEPLHATQQLERHPRK